MADNLSQHLRLLGTSLNPFAIEKRGVQLDPLLCCYMCQYVVDIHSTPKLLLAYNSGEDSYVRSKLQLIAFAM